MNSAFRTDRLFRHCLVLLLFLAAPLAHAVRTFEPLFRIVNVSGPCHVRLPGATQMDAAINGRAYPFGTTVETLAGASAIILVSAEDFITLRPLSRVRPVRTGSAAQTRLEIHHEMGLISYSIRDEIGEGNRLSVLSPVSVVDQIRGRGELILGRDSSMIVQNVRPRMGSVSVHGPHFEVEHLRSGHEIQVAVSADRSYMRLTNLGGDFPVFTENPNEQPIKIDTSPRATVKFWRQQAPMGGRLIVSVLASLPDGREIQRYAFQSTVTKPLEAIRIEPLYQPDPPRRRWWAPFGRRSEPVVDGIPLPEIEIGETLDAMEDSLVPDEVQLNEEQVGE